MSNRDIKQVDMALDDIINENRAEARRFRRRSRYLRPRRGPRRFRSRSEPKVDNRRRLLVENLNVEMQNAELKKIFEKFGTLTRCGIKFNKMGESTGKALIEFSTHTEADEALKNLSNSENNEVKLSVKYAPSSRINKFQRRSNYVKRGMLRRRRPYSMRDRRPRRFTRYRNPIGRLGRPLRRRDRRDRRDRNDRIRRRTARGPIKRRHFKNSIGRRHRRD